MPWDVVPILKLVVKNDKNYMKNYPRRKSKPFSTLFCKQVGYRFVYTSKPTMKEL